MNDEEWAKWSDHEIARRAAVSQPFVTGMRKELSNNGYQMETRAVTRDGTTYEQDTRNIRSKVDRLPCRSGWRASGSISARRLRA